MFLSYYLCFRARRAVLSTLRQPGVVRRGMEERLVKGKSLRHEEKGGGEFVTMGGGWFQRGFLSGWGALTARRSRPFHARREDTLLCTHSRTLVCARTRTRATLAELVSAWWISQPRSFCPSLDFFSTLSLSLAFSVGSSILVPFPLTRTHARTWTRTRPRSLFCSPLVTLCSFVSVCASAESEELWHTPTRAGCMVCIFGTNIYCQLVAIGVQRSFASQRW